MSRSQTNCSLLGVSHRTSCRTTARCCTGWSNWIKHRKLKYCICCLRDLFLFLVCRLSNSLYNTSISGVNPSWTSLYSRLFGPFSHQVSQVLSLLNFNHSFRFRSLFVAVAVPFVLLLLVAGALFGRLLALLLVGQGLQCVSMSLLFEGW